MKSEKNEKLDWPLNKRQNLPSTYELSIGEIQTLDNDAECSMYFKST